MKTSLAWILWTVLGLATAIGAITEPLGVLRDEGVFSAAEPGPSDAGAPAAPPEERAGPKAVVDKDTHNFQAMEVGVTGRHKFVFTNAGNQPLALSRGKSACGCCTCVCMACLPNDTIGPGESANVTLEWKSKLYVGPFRQTATILTNDPDRPEVSLLITGRFKGPVGVVPSLLRFSSIWLGQPAVATVCLYSYLKQPLEIVGCELSDPRSAEQFEVTWEPLPADQARKDPEARGGYLVRVTVKPGLPPGVFRQRIIIKTTSKTVPTIEIPIEGVVASDVSVVGGGWNAQTGVLSKGSVNSREGAEWPLLIIVRGPHAKNVRFKPVQIIPDLLKVELGKTTFTSSKALSLTRLTIRVPPGTQPATHLGSGQGEPGCITLQTDHPQVSELQILVHFAVEE